jgi:hypothetical protein
VASLLSQQKQVLDAEGNGVAGVMVMCEVCAGNATVSAAYVGNVDNLDLADAASPYSAPSDDLGYANFSSLGFVGATPGTFSSYQFFAFRSSFFALPSGP